MKNEHSADDAALGFLYQGQYALLRLWREVDDDAVIFVETLDDVVLEAKGNTLLEQLKHSLKAKPPAVSLASVQLWKTLRAWIDVLPKIDLAHTWLNLVTVADIAKGSPLSTLIDETADRGALLASLTTEAERVREERAKAAAAGKQLLPHADRAAACESFLKLPDQTRGKLLARVRIRPNQPNIVQIETALAESLTSVVKDRRSQVAGQLIEWWNVQILNLLTKKRQGGISRFELVKRHMEIVSAIQLDDLTSTFATAIHPSSYKCDSMIERQIALVGGGNSDLKRAVREEWRAREERSRWATENPARGEIISSYDDRLIEEWSDRHEDICGSCASEIDEVRQVKGLQLLRWSHYDAPGELEPIAPKITSPYYVRGTYQVLSIKGQVGWHPNYHKALGFS